MRIPDDGHPLDPPDLDDLREDSESGMNLLAAALERATALRDELAGGSPARHVSVAVTHLQTAALFLAVADAELRGVQHADQIILDGLRGV
jgi:hypothetical protein